MREWIVGRNPVYEVLRAGRRHVYKVMVAEGVQVKGNLADAIAFCRERNIPLNRVNRSLVDEKGDGHQGIAAEVNDYPYVSLDEIVQRAEKRGVPPFILILDALQDPQNLGTLLRTAEAVGVHGVCIPPRRSAKVTPAVVSASSGACEHLLVTQVNLASAIEQLKQRDVWVIGLDHGDGSQLPERINMSGAVALVVGNEGQGMRRLVQKSCDLIMRLPMEGAVESLNAAIAGSVALYMIYQTRRVGK